ncbi:hypothetical protein HDV01_000757 [Terramyces sp. JEL0728]|nr:hypothetical protein HDV01_000757 [Terramyces sp. JEL0728]
MSFRFTSTSREKDMESELDYTSPVTPSSLQLSVFMDNQLGITLNDSPIKEDTARELNPERQERFPETPGKNSLYYSPPFPNYTNYEQQEWQRYYPMEEYSGFSTNLWFPNGAMELVSPGSYLNQECPSVPSEISSPVIEKTVKYRHSPNRKRPKHVGKACVHCKKAHLACDSNRPCKRCKHLGKDDCVDVEHKRRGRPKSTKRKDKEFKELEFLSSIVTPDYGSVSAAAE